MKYFGVMAPTRSGAFFLVTWLVLLANSPVAVAGVQDTDEKKANAGKQESMASTDVVKRGAAIGKSPVVKLADVTKSPEEYLDKTVVFEATVAEVCQKKGCWMEVTAGDATTRVTFKDYGFFVPMDSGGMQVRVEGVFVTKTLSKEQADHLVAEGAHIARNEDGTASELGFVASGVELRAVPKDPGQSKDAPSESPRESDKGD